MENPILIFIDAADDAAAYPLSAFHGMTIASDATILMRFTPSFNPIGAADTDVDLVTVTCTADKELKVFKSIAAGINAAKRNNGEGYVVIADDVNSTYVDSDITGIAITLGS
tara:strand:- start:19 stop:354 length:336 start_codon:yes stop_codon:yes gene_type:complete